MEEREKNEKFIEVSVITTAGSYPDEGTERVPSHQKINVVLKKAVQFLKITDTSGWVATTTVNGNGKTLNIDDSYIDNGLLESVEIDYGPNAGGGGRCTI